MSPTQPNTDKYTAAAAELLPLLGGAANILTLTHCITRLRITLANQHAVNHPALRDHPAVLGHIATAESLHLIVGPAAAARLAHACTTVVNHGLHRADKLWCST